MLDYVRDLVKIASFTFDVPLQKTSQSILKPKLVLFFTKN